MVTLRSLYCGATRRRLMCKVSGEDLLRHWNKIESVVLGKYPYCHYLTTK